LVIAAAHLRRSRGANGGGFARRRFHSETVAGVVSETVAGDPDDHPIPRRRTLLHVHDLGRSKSTLRRAGSTTMLWAASAIKCRPAGTAPKQSNQRRASSLSSTCRCRMAQMPPRLPFGMPRSRPSGRKAFAPRAPKPVPRTVDTTLLPKAFTASGQLQT
jgi:hypothetical protein